MLQKCMHANAPQIQCNSVCLHIQLHMSFFLCAITMLRVCVCHSAERKIHKHLPLECKQFVDVRWFGRTFFSKNEFILIFNFSSNKKRIKMVHYLILLPSVVFILWINMTWGFYSTYTDVIRKA